MKIGRLGLRCGAILALAIYEGCLGGPETPISARKGSGLAEISAIHEVAPPEACRRVSLEIDFSGLRGGAISALAVAQGYLVGLETRIRGPETRVGPETRTSIEIFSFIVIISSITWNEGIMRLHLFSRTPTMQRRGKIYFKQVSLDSCWLLQYSA